jgi:hypothetical protein
MCNCIKARGAPPGGLLLPPRLLLLLPLRLGLPREHVPPAPPLPPSLCPLLLLLLLLRMRCRAMWVGLLVLPSCCFLLHGRPPALQLLPCCHRTSRVVLRRQAFGEASVATETAVHML